MKDTVKLVKIDKILEKFKIQTTKNYNIYTFNSYFLSNYIINYKKKVKFSKKKLVFTI